LVGKSVTIVPAEPISFDPVFRPAEVMPPASAKPETRRPPGAAGLGSIWPHGELFTQRVGQIKASKWANFSQVPKLERRGSEPLYLISMIDDATKRLSAPVALHDSTAENRNLPARYLL